MQNLEAYFKDKGFLGWGGKELLAMHADNHLVRLRMGEKRPHLGILHYRDDVVFGKGRWDNFNKACRGVVVDFNEGKVLTHGFNKFFNVGESQAPSIRELEKRKSFWATEKLDGSCILLYWDETTKSVVATTKGSLDSEQGQYAQSLIPSSVNSKELVYSRYTLVFELISSKFQIVIPYDKVGYEEGLYLTAVRERKSEKLFDPPEVQAFAKEYGLKTYKIYPFGSLQEMIEDTEKLPYTREGYVIRYAGEELLVKLKSKAYLAAHRFLSSLGDKHILDVLIAGEEQTIYDNLGIVAEEYRSDVESTVEDFKKRAYQFRDECYRIFSECPRDNRKTFALYVNNLPLSQSKYKRFLFGLLDGRDPQLSQIYMTFK